MRILFAGTPEVAVPSLQALLESEHQVVAVLTRPDAPVGRKRVLTPSPVKVVAQEAGIQVIEANRLRGDVVTRIERLHADAAAVVAFGALAGPRSLAAVAHGWFNLHFSLLPEYRGAAPVQRALIDGRTESGVTVFKLTEGLDTGPIVARQPLPLGDRTAGEVLADYAKQGAGVLVAALDDVAAGSATYTEQPESGTIADKLTSADGYLDLRLPADTLAARARGVSPAPGAWTTAEGKRTKLAGIGLARIDVTTDLAAGAVALAPDGTGALVGTGSSPLYVERIQPFGKPMMDFADYLRGHGGLTLDARPYQEGQ